MIMNTLLKYIKTFYYVLAAALIIPYSTAATHINGHPIEFLASEGEITYESFYHATNICFHFDDSNIITGSLGQSNLLPQASNIYESIKSQRDIAATFVYGKDIKIDIVRGASFIGSYVKAGKDWVVSAGEAINCINTDAEINNDVLFTTPILKTSNFFLTTSEKVEFNALAPQSWLTGISFTPSRDFKRPFAYMFEGTIDFNESSKGGYFVAVGAKALTFKLKKLNS